MIRTGDYQALPWSRKPRASGDDPYIVLVRSRGRE